MVCTPHTDFLGHVLNGSNWSKRCWHGSRSTCEPYLYVLLRIIAGLLFACHGAQKLFGVFGGVGGHPGATVPLFSQMGLAGIIELVGGLLIAVWDTHQPCCLYCQWRDGLCLLPRALPAWLLAHPKRGELAVLNCFLFLYVPPMVRGYGV